MADIEPPKDYVDDRPESSGTRIDRAFWWLTDRFLPDWLKPDGTLATWVVDQLFIDCFFCAIARGLFIGFLAGVACTIAICLIMVALF